MEIFSRSRLALRWLSVGVLALGLSGLLPGAARAAISYSVLQINICNSGYAGCYTGRATEQTPELINARTPSVVTVNEICESDLGTIQSRTGYAGLFTQSGTQLCKNGSAYGNAILFPAGTSVGTPERITYSAQDAQTELRTLTCVPAAGVTVCVTHLATTSVKTDQAAQMKDVVGAHAGQGATVLGGDWNMTYGGNPNAQDFVPSGMFRKGDSNVQHIVSSSAHFTLVSTRVMDLNWTDHDALQVYLTR